MSKRNFSGSGAVFLIFAVVMLITSGVLLFISPVAAVITLMSELLLCTVLAIHEKRRRRAAAGLSERIDRVLHGYDEMLISESREGELAVLEDEIEKMTVRLREQRDRLERDKVFLADALADISHQLRTPLTAMNLTVQLLSEQQLSEERKTALTRELKRSLSRLDKLIASLLKMSRIDAGAVSFKSDTVSVRELIKEAAEPLMIMMELKGIDFSVSAGDESFKGDAQWSEEALGNIIKNCVEHTGSGGRVTVEARETPVFTEIRVSDNGGGIDEEELPHIFERFYKGKNASPDSIGIGLALARMLTVEQGGTLSAANRDGGAEFTLRFYKTVL